MVNNLADESTRTDSLNRSCIQVGFFEQKILKNRAEKERLNYLYLTDEKKAKVDAVGTPELNEMRAQGILHQYYDKDLKVSSIVYHKIYGKYWISCGSRAHFEKNGVTFEIDSHENREEAIELTLCFCLYHALLGTSMG